MSEKNSCANEQNGNYFKKQQNIPFNQVARRNLFTMPKNFLVVNWKAIDGSARQRKMLRLRRNTNGKFMCFIEGCLHTGFKSNRGLRKHIDARHPWYYYFDKEPSVKREVIEKEKEKLKQPTNSIPSFSVTSGIGKEFLDWLVTPLGGGKSQREANQTAKRAMKFLMAALSDSEDGSNATNEYVDCCLGSAAIVIKFMETVTKEWALSSSAALNYLKSMSDLLDFRKAQGVSDTVLRSFTVTEVYIRRGKENLRKQKVLEYGRNLDLETLIAKDSWANIEEMEKVIPYHAPRFKEIVEKCSDEAYSPTTSELAFATRFVVTYLFLRVKCSRPMTFQYMTLEMVVKSKSNGGFIDQTEFKTSSKYTFDTLIITPEVQKVLGIYIETVRPHLNPSCDYVLVTNGGKQYTSFSTAMALLVKEAIGKYINPTRYRQIVETESASRLSSEEQSIISRDQKHSSNVAERSYKKRLSRDIATKGKQCMEKMLGENRNESTTKLTEILDSINTTCQDFDESLLDKVGDLLQGNSSAVADGYDKKEELPGCSNSSRQTVIDSSDLQITGSKSPSKSSSSSSTSSLSILNEDTLLSMWPDGNQNVKVKQETYNKTCLRGEKKVAFSFEEDKSLFEGIKKHGKGRWSKILKDITFSFHECRNRDSLRMRFESASYRHSVKKLTSREKDT